MISKFFYVNSDGEKIHAWLSDPHNIRSQVLFGNQDAFDAWLESVGEKQPDPAQLELPFKKCDCGSESAGSSRHSTWCSAYEK